MTYDEAMRYIHGVSSLGTKPGLERIEKLLSLMGNPEKECRFIQVAGTNGKGSVCSMLSSVLTAAGYKTGLYTSPFVKYFEERIMLGGEMISHEDLAEITSYVKSFADRMDDRPTEFEIITAVGLEYYKRTKPDIVILEAGMGGRYDATNAVKNTVLSVITGIALDHTEYLGDTVEKIASEKAGIIKNNAPVVFGGENDSAAGVIKAEAEKLGSSFVRTERKEIKVSEYGEEYTVLDYKEHKNIKLSLIGSYQPYNAATVMEAVSLLPMNISDEALRKGLFGAVWHARMERLYSSPVIYYDGGHNPEGTAAAADSIDRIFGGIKPVLLMGVLRDKDYRTMVKRFSKSVCRVFTITPGNKRALNADALAEEYIKSGIPAKSFEMAESGVKAAVEYAKSENKPLFISGSLYMYGEITDILEKIMK